MKTVLVTGASGFVAEHLLGVLKLKGFYVIGLDRKLEPSGPCDEFINIDLIDLTSNHLKKYNI